MKYWGGTYDRVFTLTVLTLLVIAIIHPGKTPPLDHTLMEFANAVPANFPAPGAYNAETAGQIAAATIIAAQEHEIAIKRFLD